jgi:ribosomal protein L17
MGRISSERATVASLMQRASLMDLFVEVGRTQAAGATGYRMASARHRRADNDAYCPMRGA